MEFTPDWENTKLEVSDGKVCVTMFGHINLPEHVCWEALDPETFMVALIRGMVPVKQRFAVADRRSTTSPIVVDFDKLNSGTYDCRRVAYEDMRKDG